MNDTSKRLTRMAIIIGGVTGGVALVALLLTLMLTSPAARDETAGLDGVQTQAGQDDTAATCDFPEAWIGEPVDEAAVKKAAKVSRILPPGAAATMDYNPARLNVETDDKGVVVRVTCG